MTEPCTSLAGAWQLTGDFELRASLTGEVEEAPCCFYDSWAEARVSVELDGQGCHPETAEVQLVIDTEDWACVDTGGC